MHGVAANLSEYVDMIYSVLPACFRRRTVAFSSLRAELRKDAAGRRTVEELRILNLATRCAPASTALALPPAYRPGPSHPGPQPLELQAAQAP